MARYPGAIWQPVGWANADDRRRSGAATAITLHSTAGGDANPKKTVFDKGGACSHFWINYAGDVYQFIDTAYMSAADIDSYQGVQGGDHRTIAIESSSNVGATDEWTPAQVAAFVKLLAWISTEENIPLRLMASSATSEHGVAPHRFGVNGNFPALPSPYAGRTQRGGGEIWSKATGKMCPGNARIDQIPALITQAAIAAGDVKGGGGTSKPTGTTKPTKPSTPAKPSSSKLDVDGRWGPATTRRLQEVLGTTVDGVLSGQVKGSWNSAVASASWGTGGSQAVRAIQKRLGLTVDGNLGPKTITAMQKHFGTTRDGVISAPSDMVRAMQKSLNEGKF